MGELTLFVSLMWRLKRSRGGAAAVEFVLVLPALAALMFGTIQAGLLVFTYNTMVSVARDNARAMAVCSIGPVTAASYANAARLPWIDAAAWNVVTSVNSPDASVTITVPSAEAMILTYVPFALPNLTTTVDLLQEPLAYGGGSCGNPALP